MMNLKTTALLGNLSRQNVSRQLMPLTNSKNSVLNLSQRTSHATQPVTANAPRSFSSSQASRDNNTNTPTHHHHNVTGAHQFQYNPSFAQSLHTPYLSSSARFQNPLTANLNFRKEATNGNKTIPRYSQISKNAWDAINGQDARAVFPFLQEMRHEGFYADTALSSRIVSHFLDMNAPQDAERALVMLVDCHQSQGRTLSTSQKNTYTALAKDIVNHSSDFSQALSFAKLLDRHGLLASSGLADGTLRSYRQLKTAAGLDVVKRMISSSDIETLLILQSSLVRISARYKHLIEILLDAKEMNILSRGRKIERVLEVYEEMVQHRIRPNAITYGTLISACTRVGSEDMARNLFQEMVNAPNYHARHGPHNAMIQFYVRQKKDRQAALKYYEDMLQRRLTPTEHTYTLLIEAHACIQPYDLTEANRLIQSLKRGPVKASESHYGALIHAYGVEHRDLSTAETVFENMRKSGIIPKGPAYQSLIESYITDGQVSKAVELRNQLLESGQSSSAYIENTLIRGYGQNSDIGSAERVFEAMLDPHGNGASGAQNGVITKEPSTYQSMVSAYLENGMVDRAYETLARMRRQHYPELVVKPVEEAIHASVASLESEVDQMSVASA
ncbi:hypothetical protein BGZ52_003865 [Haplosporangium bisporale]|nr:hypothetical protein BGZ52_003865 [Haplosporangium bisporale]